MAYSGRYTVKNPSKYRGNPNNVVYRSLWERYCFKWCDESSNVKYWSSEETVIPYFYEVDKKYHRYFVDLKVTFTNGETWLIEIKPHKQTLPPDYPGKKTRRYINESIEYVRNQCKWKAANNYALDRGYKFSVWTEETLEKLGIKPKSTKPLKPYRKRKK